MYLTPAGAVTTENCVPAAAIISARVRENGAVQYTSLPLIEKCSPKELLITTGQDHFDAPCTEYEQGGEEEPGDDAAGVERQPTAKNIRSEIEPEDADKNQDDFGGDYGVEFGSVDYGNSDDDRAAEEEKQRIIHQT